MNTNRFKTLFRLSIPARLLVILLLTLGGGRPGGVVSAPVHASESPAEEALSLSASSLARASAADTYWSIETVDPGGNVGKFTSLAIDSADRFHVSYQDTVDTALRYAVFDGSTWITTTVDNSGDVGQHTSIDLDDSEYPHISHYESGVGLRHAYWTGLASGLFSSTPLRRNSEHCPGSCNY